MGILPTRVSEHYMCAQYPQRLEEDIRHPGKGVIDSELPCAYWDSNAFDC